VPGTITLVGFGPSSTRKYVTSYYRISASLTMTRNDTGSVILKLAVDDGAVVVSCPSMHR
jgi:hypothetical protein